MDVNIDYSGLFCLHFFPDNGGPSFLTGSQLPDWRLLSSDSLASKHGQVTNFYPLDRNKNDVSTCGKVLPLCLTSLRPPETWQTDEVWASIHFYTCGVMSVQNFFHGYMEKNSAVFNPLSFLSSAAKSKTNKYSFLFGRTG